MLQDHVLADGIVRIFIILIYITVLLLSITFIWRSGFISNSFLKYYTAMGIHIKYSINE